MKAKGQVYLRKRKIKSGYSLYLDIYSKGLRRYEYLNLYLKDERSPEDRAFNREIYAVAQAVAARRLIEVQRNAAALAIPSDTSLRKILSDYVEGKRGSGGTYEIWRCYANRVGEFKGIDLSLKDLNKDWWRLYVRWVDSQGFKASTRHHYLARMRCILNRAEKEGLLLVNPSHGERIGTPPRPERVWLTEEELRKMKAVSYGTITERAFLFGCLTGLRYSDIRSLRWEDIQGGKLVKRIVKTRRTEYLDLNSQAIDLMGDRGTGIVFPGLMKTTRTANYRVSKWAQRAGIAKHISFHTARHTFAVLMLSAGVDIYTVSRLLGHSSITTTQIYADIVDAKKKEAVNLLPRI